VKSREEGSVRWIRKHSYNYFENVFITTFLKIFEFEGARERERERERKREKDSAHGVNKLKKITT
jgi:hypothetical protein